MGRYNAENFAIEKKLPDCPKTLMRRKILISVFGQSGNFFLIFYIDCCQDVCDQDRTYFTDHNGK